MEIKILRLELIHSMVWLGQDEKPDWHSYIILLSHLGYLFCTWVSYTQGLSILSLNFAFATCISILYHLCDESIVCAGKLMFSS